jgi:hypothetical protein
MIVIGIDPGVNTGVAVWDTTTQQFLDVRCSGIVSAMLYIDRLRNTRKVSLVVFEDARLRKWIPREKDLSQFRGRAMGAGSVKRDCAIWEEWCKGYGIDFVASPPKNGKTKLSGDTFRRITGYTGRTNEHSRDAAMLVFGR